jgi:hypothetical protein
MPKIVRRGASRQLLKQAQKREQLRCLWVMERPQVLQQLHHHLSHNTAERSSSQQNIDSYIYQLRPLDLNTRKNRDNSYCMWLNSLKLSCWFGCLGGWLRRADGYAGRMVTPGTSVYMHLLSTHQRCSIGLRLGEYAGHSMQLMWSLRWKAATAFERCMPALSCINSSERRQCGRRPFVNAFI